MSSEFNTENVQKPETPRGSDLTYPESQTALRTYHPRELRLTSHMSSDSRMVYVKTAN